MYTHAWRADPASRTATPWSVVNNRHCAQPVTARSAGAAGNGGGVSAGWKVQDPTTSHAAGAAVRHPVPRRSA
jgi:hypothetical protein